MREKSLSLDANTGSTNGGLCTAEKLTEHPALGRTGIMFQVPFVYRLFYFDHDLFLKSAGAGF